MNNNQGGVAPNFANIKFGIEFRVYFHKKYKVAILLFLLLR